MMLRMDEFEELMKRYPVLLPIKEDIYKAYELLKRTYEASGKVLICGNGGSASDSEHIVGELMKGFLKKRPLPKEEIGRFRDMGDDFAELPLHLQKALPAISLVSQNALITAFSNDVEPDMIFAQQVYGYSKGKPDALIAMSTTGNSKNVVNAAKVAKVIGVPTIGITGETSGLLAKFCDVCIKIPERETYKVQELTLPVYHTICIMLENAFFEN